MSTINEQTDLILDQINNAKKVADNPFGFEILVDDKVTGGKYGQLSEGAKQIVMVNADGTMKGLPKVMGSNYNPMPIKQFLQHVNDFRTVGGFDEPKFYYDGNARIFAFLPNPTNKQWTINGSTMETSMIIATSFDGTLSFVIGGKTYFHRCNNMFSNIAGAVKVKNSKNAMAGHIANYKAEVGGFENQMAKFREDIDRMMETEVDSDIMADSSKKLFEIPKGIDMKWDSDKLKDFGVSSRKLNMYHDFQASLRTETAELGQNAWGFFNGVTHWTTHQREGLANHGLNAKAFKVNAKGYDIATSLVTV